SFQCRRPRQRPTCSRDHGHGRDICDDRQDDRSGPAVSQTVDRRRLIAEQGSGWRPGPWLASAVAIVFVAGGLPLASLGIVALRDLRGAGAALLSSQPAVLLGNTVGLGLFVALLVGALGTVLGLLVAKTDMAGRRPLMALLTFPLFLPPYLVALGWFAVLGRQGLIAALFGAGSGIGACRALCRQGRGRPRFVDR